MYLLCCVVRKRAPFPQVNWSYVTRRGSAIVYMTDVDPPRYEARHATSWLVLFMTHVASCGAGAVIKSSQEPGQSRKHFPGHGWFIGKITGTDL